MSTSSSIWTRCAGASRVAPLRVDAWRVVEAQHQVSTRKLVDSDAEQQLLEQLIETVKPPARTSALHYLLFTPFRYPPLKHGSRFGARFESGLWYGAETQRTAFAEVAYYRLLFLEGTSADLGMVQTELTAFSIRVETARGIDLTVNPFAKYRAQLINRTDYTETQTLGLSMREAGVIAFRYESARDTDGGVCVGVFDPAAFGRRSPKRFETWHCVATKEQGEVVKRDYFDREGYEFGRHDLF